MFSNLMQGSILYGVNVKTMSFFSAPVTKVTIPKQNLNLDITQFPQTFVDISATVKGELKEFRQIPSNSSIADFGNDTVILADSREALGAYITSKRQEDVNVVQSIDMRKKRIQSYDAVLKQIMPGYTNDEDVKNLNTRINNLETQLAEAIALLKENNKTKQHDGNKV